MKMNVECQFWDAITRILGLIQSNDSCVMVMSWFSVRMLSF